MATDAAPVSAPLASLAQTVTPVYAGDVGDAEQRITRQFAVFLGAGYLVYVLLTAGDIVNSFSVSSMWWAASAPVVIFGSGVAVGIAGFRGSMRTIRICVAIASAGYLLMVLTWFVAWNGEQLSTNRGLYFSQFNGIPALAVALICRMRWAMVYLTVVATAVATVGYYVRAPAFTSPLAGEIAWSFGFCMTFVVAAGIGIRTARILDETRSETYQIAGNAAALSAREGERVRFDALTHDGVMSTLLSAARQGSSPEVIAQARSTIAKLGQLRTSDSGVPVVDDDEVMAQLRNTVAEIDDTVTVDVLGRTTPPLSYPAEAVRTICAATGEALRNSVRHAGPNARPAIAVSLSSDELSILVSDDGVGFDPATVASHRLGIAVSIRGRMQQLRGGSVDVDSAPGRGTRVHLRWATA